MPDSPTATPPSSSWWWRKIAGCDTERTRAPPKLIRRSACCGSVSSPCGGSLMVPTCPSGRLSTTPTAPSPVVCRMRTSALWRYWSSSAKGAPAASTVPATTESAAACCFRSSLSRSESSSSRAPASSSPPISSSAAAALDAAPISRPSWSPSSPPAGGPACSPSPRRRRRTHSRSMSSANDPSWSSSSDSRPMARMSRSHVPRPSPPSRSSPATFGSSRGSARGSAAWCMSSLRRMSEPAAARNHDPRSSSLWSWFGAHPAYPTNTQKSLRFASPASTSSLAAPKEHS
mmetsp:Transcript_14849/g.48654  ORF Transcript_14849/g.48654 Transcript_14849/m.48654 type:complete len:289 (+) Transcript_14849:581-1447(+)